MKAIIIWEKTTELWGQVAEVKVAELVSLSSGRSDCE
jgi:hypothetical protein